ncbi:MAG: ATPase, T2SS/T4P/T4SS family [Elusimicrobiota bacterium]|jgi:type IV pilus assembly protein PilB
MASSGNKGTANPRGIIDLLVNRKLATEAQLQPATEESRKSEKPIQQIIVDSKILEKNVILKALSEEWRIKAVNLSDMEVDMDVVKAIPEATARRHHAVPFAKEDNVLFLAMMDPRDFFAIEDIQLRTGFEVQPYLALPADVDALLDKAYGSTTVANEVSVEDIIKGVAASNTGGGDDELLVGQPEELSDVADVSADAPEVEKLVNAIILGALQQKASDIHIEPFEKRLLLRYRVDGNLREAPFALPYTYRNALLAKIKIMTNQMDITEHRKPQDGRIQVTAKGKPIEFRVNVVPTVFGESCVMRVLDRASIQVEMGKMGFLPDTLKTFQDILQRPYGLVLVCGPTGSGKSTTLYAALNSINTSDVKILTAENPVEYNLNGIVQVNINQEIGFDFATALRSFLRQDPDIIMVGEIRDKETAQIAMEAAMTGHLVFSTIHTNDAPSAVARLHEMGVPNFLVASTIEAVLAQRLVRRICKDCKEPIPMTAEHKKLFDEYHIDISKAQLFKGKGCGTCNLMGYKGRLGIHELLVMNNDIRTLCLKEAASGPIRELAIKAGMRGLFEDGLRKVVMGLTTVEEVLAVSMGAGS